MYVRIICSMNKCLEVKPKNEGDLNIGWEISSQIQDLDTFRRTESNDESKLLQLKIEISAYKMKLGNKNHLQVRKWIEVLNHSRVGGTL